MRGSACAAEIAQVVRVHRLPETQALVGFSRLEPVTPDSHGEYAADVARGASW